MATTTLAERLRYFVGIDVSKEVLDAWIRPDGRYIRPSNHMEGFSRLHRWLLAHGCRPDNTLICMENTGSYNKRLLMALAGWGWKCAVEKTTVLDKVSLEHHRKEDRYDAQLLAEYADRFTDRLQMHRPFEEPVEQLRQLFSERRRLVRQRTALMNRHTQLAQEPYPCQCLPDYWEQQRQLFDKHITLLEEQLEQIVTTHPGLAGYYRLLLGIPGIGPVTGWLWLILFYGESRLHPKQIASRFGFAPHPRQSGSSLRGKARSSGHGKAAMRAVMTMAARSVSIHCPRFCSYAQRKRSEGKPWPVIRNNIINKLITIICAIWNSGQPYDPKHSSRFDRQKKSV